MVRRKIKTKVKPMGVNLLLYGLALLVLMNVLARLGIADLTPLQPDVLTLIAILFVATEIGVVSALRGNKKLDGIHWFGAIVAGFALLFLVLGWLGMSIAVTETFKGFVEIALLVFVILEIFN